MVKKYFTIWLLLLCLAQISHSEEHFEIRGTLPWHNFLSGPSAWNLEDYIDYLDWMESNNLNFIGFHCYTGGSERYVNYVEPMIRVQYRNVLPLAEFDTSLTSRWGYWPLPTNEFAFDSDQLFKHKAYGADVALEAENNAERYELAQDLMKKVMKEAHQRGIKFCIGFEFGVYPPEFLSILPPGSMVPSPYVPNPFHFAHQELLRLYIEDIANAYPLIDYVWFWLQEMYNPHSGIHVGGRFGEFIDENEHYFGYLDDEFMSFNGLWSLAYIQQAHKLMQEILPDAKMVISGWGGNHQLPPLLPGLNEALPTDIIFSCLSPNQGWKIHPPELSNIKQRDVWIIPWLEGDRRLWHPQPRVSILAEHIAKAKDQDVDGVLGIHWRTHDIAMNIDALGEFTKNVPTISDNNSNQDIQQITEDFYRQWGEPLFSEQATNALLSHFVKFDIEQTLATGNDSPEYYPYQPDWGRMNDEIKTAINEFVSDIENQLNKTENAKHKKNLKYILHTLNGIKQLDTISQHLQPAWQLYQEHWSKEEFDQEWLNQCKSALDEMKQAPIKEFIENFSNRVADNGVMRRGDLGLLSAINQKLWTFHQKIETFLNNQIQP